MNQQEKRQFCIDHGFAPDVISQCETEVELDAFVAAVTRPRADGRVSRVDGDHLDNDDEMRELIARFDAAPGRLADYVAAEPWRIGERAAMAIAWGTGDGRSAQGFGVRKDTQAVAQSYVDAGTDQELAELIARFDQAPARLEAYVLAEPWRIGENAAMAMAIANAVDFAPMPAGSGEAAITGAGLERQGEMPNRSARASASAREGLSGFFSAEVLQAMSDRQVAEAEAALKAAADRVLALGGVGPFSTVAGG